MHLITSTYKTKPLKLSGFYTYQQDKQEEILTSAHTLCLCIFYGSQNKKRFFCVQPTTLTVLFFQPRRNVFTARYGLDV